MIRKSSNRHPTCQDIEVYAVRLLHLRIDVPVGRLHLQVDVLAGGEVQSFGEHWGPSTQRYHLKQPILEMPHSYTFRSGCETPMTKVME